MTDPGSRALSDATSLAESASVVTPPTLPVHPDGSVAPLNLGDRIVREVAFAMRAGQWDGRKSLDDIALRHGITRGSAEQYASQAGRYLRIDGTPDGMLAWLVTELQGIVEEGSPDRVPAIKVLLDTLEKMAARRGGRPQDAGGTPEVRVLLRAPPPELVEVLREEVFRAPVAELEEAMRAEGWSR